MKITNLENGMQWERNLNDEEYPHVMQMLQSRKDVDFLPATLQPVRTNTWKNFAQDFFLPTTLNHAIKIEIVVIKIFACLGTLILDLLTFPVRLVTCIPRAISNAQQEEHALQTYLLEQGVTPTFLSEGRLRVSMKKTASDQTREGLIKEWYKVSINLIEFPKYDHHERRGRIENPSRPVESR